MQHSLLTGATRLHQNQQTGMTMMAEGGLACRAIVLPRWKLHWLTQQQ
jgi:hypothetical protein